ncbi:collagen alpha-1(I) chain-like [Dipodomys spectabilis]|uniref:collagen alpha-1(I) chain-like n=1 Tax=Dipodomys spectabilis TaxID=105255 RepID=UPI001C53A831|nr:collagen alpha-1(I) chain-like [Dipodomys spectabilis]
MTPCLYFLGKVILPPPVEAEPPALPVEPQRGWRRPAAPGRWLVRQLSRGSRGPPGFCGTQRQPIRRRPRGPPARAPPRAPSPATRGSRRPRSCREDGFAIRPDHTGGRHRHAGRGRPRAAPREMPELRQAAPCARGSRRARRRPGRCHRGRPPRDGPAGRGRRGRRAGTGGGPGAGGTGRPGVVSVRCPGHRGEGEAAPRPGQAQQARGPPGTPGDHRTHPATPGDHRTHPATPGDHRTDPATPLPSQTRAHPSPHRPGHTRHRTDPATPLPSQTRPHPSPHRARRGGGRTRHPRSAPRRTGPVGRRGRRVCADCGRLAVAERRRRVASAKARGGRRPRPDAGPRGDRRVSGCRATEEPAADAPRSARRAAGLPAPPPRRPPPPRALGPALPSPPAVRTGSAGSALRVFLAPAAAPAAVARAQAAAAEVAAPLPRPSAARAPPRPSAQAQTP